MKKPYKILLTGLLLILLVLVVFYSYRFWQIKTGRIVKVGDTWITIQAFYDQYGDPQNPVAESKNTPEEVYVKFREAILVNNVEEALKYIVPEKVEEYRKELSDSKVLEKYKALPEVSKVYAVKGEAIGSYNSYEYIRVENGKKIAYSVDFFKNREGYWLLRNI